MWCRSVTKLLLVWVLISGCILSSTAQETTTDSESTTDTYTGATPGATDTTPDDTTSTRASDTTGTTSTLDTTTSTTDDTTSTSTDASDTTTTLDTTAPDDTTVASTTGSNTNTPASTVGSATSSSAPTDVTSDIDTTTTDAPEDSSITVSNNTGSPNASSETTGETKETTFIPTTTPDPCAGICGEMQECSENCTCKDSLSLSQEGICAEPCTSSLTWCGEGGKECITLGKGEYECECGANYYPAARTCVLAKFVGGEITFNNEYPASMEEGLKIYIQNILDSFYTGVAGFKKSVVLSTRSGSIIATYKLAFSMDTEIDSDLTDQLKTSFRKHTDGCKDEYTANSTFLNDSYVVDCDASLNAIGNNTVMCAEYKDTLQCENDDDCAYDGGEVGCRICSGNSQCNDPFGTCKDSETLNANCECFYGFYGERCKEPWLFVFTVTTSGLVLILIIVLTTCICMSRKNKGVSKKSQPQDDIDLKNPFVDFQPGVRAKVPNHLYSSISDPLESSNGRANGAYSSAYDELNLNKTTTFTEGNTSGNEYF